MRQKKFCHVCGLKVDLRVDSYLPNMPNLNENVRNKEYWYIHKKCWRK